MLGVDPNRCAMHEDKRKRKERKNSFLGGESSTVFYLLSFVSRFSTVSVTVSKNVTFQQSEHSNSKYMYFSCSYEV
jgi:hypothetical protein